MKRPLLTAKLDPQLFKDFYWMKKELTDFCGQQSLSTSGMKPEIAERVFTFLKTGRKLKPKIEKINVAIDSQKPLTRKTRVVNYKNDPVTRQFFLNEIGPHFKFSARVNIFRKEKIVVGEKITYGDLIDEWQHEYATRKNKEIKLPIMKSCEYNQFTRDFYSARKNCGRQEVIAAWKQVRSVAGPNTYQHWDQMFNR